MAHAVEKGCDLTSDALCPLSCDHLPLTFPSAVKKPYVAFIKAKVLGRWRPGLHAAALAVDGLHGSAVVDRVEPVAAAILPVAPNHSRTAGTEIQGYGSWWQGGRRRSGSTGEESTEEMGQLWPGPAGRGDWTILSLAESVCATRPRLAMPRSPALRPPVPSVPRHLSEVPGQHFPARRPRPPPVVLR